MVAVSMNPQSAEPVAILAMLGRVGVSSFQYSLCAGDSVMPSPAVPGALANTRAPNMGRVVSTPLIKIGLNRIGFNSQNPAKRIRSFSETVAQTRPADDA